MATRRMRVILAAAGLVLATAAPAQARGSPSVAALQVALRAEGLYAATVDGVAGPATRAAVVAFQRRAHLAADGIAGPRTRRALGRRGRPALGARIIHGRARGWDVAALQFLLAWRGFPSGPIDGGFGPRTAAALVRFQAWAGLAPDGLAGRATLAALSRPPPRAGLAFARPVAAAIGDGFGPRGNRFHGGVDFVAPAGAPVYAARAGRVASAGWDSGGYGWLIVLDHGGGVTTWYAHLSRLLVGRGQAVPAGAFIGRVGATGRATGPHLHFSVYLNAASVDPAIFLPPEQTP